MATPLALGLADEQPLRSGVVLVQSLAHEVSLCSDNLIYTDIRAELMDIGQIYTDIGELNRHSCRSIQSWASE